MLTAILSALLHNLYCTAAGLYPQRAIMAKALHLAKHFMIGSRSAVTLVWRQQGIRREY